MSKGEKVDIGRDDHDRRPPDSDLLEDAIDDRQELRRVRVVRRSAGVSGGARHGDPPQRLRGSRLKSFHRYGRQRRNRHGTENGPQQGVTRRGRRSLAAGAAGPQAAPDRENTGTTEPERFVHNECFRRAPGAPHEAGSCFF